MATFYDSFFKALVFLREMENFSYYINEELSPNKNIYFIFGICDK